MSIETPNTIALSEREIAAFLLRPATLFERLLPFLRPIAAATLTVSLLFGAYSFLSQTPTERSVSAAGFATPSATIAPVAVITPEATPVPTATPTPVPLTAESTLVYDAFSISAPVLWDTPFSSKDVDKALGDGLVHLADTPKPGQEGYTVVFGHSSSLPWVKGAYKDVFAPIVKAHIGDEILLTYQNTSYRYAVTRTYEVKPSDLEILKSSPGDQGIRLVTCTPIGTSLRRFVVEANQIPL